jgi:GST-like protein
MLDLYFWMTPNGYKITILLEELGLDYNIVPVHIGRGEQFSPDFLKISPNNKIPALVDHTGSDGEPVVLFESGAIMMYLAERTGWRFMHAEPRRRYHVIQWLMFQMGGIGPMLGQAHHFRRYAKERIPYAIERYAGEATRLYRVLDRRLGEAEFLAAIIQSPIWRFILGCGRTNGRARILPPGRICSVGTMQSAPAPRCSAVWR